MAIFAFVDLLHRLELIAHCDNDLLTTLVLLFIAVVAPDADNWDRMHLPGKQLNQNCCCRALQKLR